MKRREGGASAFHREARPGLLGRASRWNVSNPAVCFGLLIQLVGVTVWSNRCAGVSGEVQLADSLRAGRRAVAVMNLIPMPI